MPRKIESYLLDGPAGKLEALLEEPEHGEPAEAILVCHPHPKGGGTMHNKVVYRIARGLRKNGAVVLRFNYRGVNRSEGVYDNGRGETDDARVALEWLRRQYPDLPFSVAGFSFGSRIALRLACTMPGARRAMVVGFPMTYADHRSVVLGCTVPKIFIQSTNDEFGPAIDLESLFAEAVLPPKQLIFIPAEDHFFKGGLDAFEEAVVAAGLSAARD
jgi:uncharacterized protein